MFDDILWSNKKKRGHTFDKGTVWGMRFSRTSIRLSIVVKRSKSSTKAFSRFEEFTRDWREAAIARNWEHKDDVSTWRNNGNRCKIDWPRAKKFANFHKNKTKGKEEYGKEDSRWHVIIEYNVIVSYHTIIAKWQTNPPSQKEYIPRVP